ncbi:MAG: LytR/AlgR family response regulator transcription factor, partial [Muribaculaceae bacterium]
MKKIVIIEDEKPNSDELQNMLRRMYPDYDVETVLRTVKSVRNYFSEGIWPDLVFSDIQLTDGVVFDAFSDESISLRIVFLTAYDNYVMQALEYNCVQYL